MSIKLTSGGGKDFDPVPSGVHQGVCYGVVDLGTHMSKNRTHKPSRKLVILFELPHERQDFGKGKEEPRAISANYTQSLNEKAILRKDLQTWRGRPFTEEELKGFDPKVLIGVNAQLNIIHKQEGDKVYANISGIMPLSKGQPKVAQENPPLYFSLDDQSDLTNITFPENGPEWLQKKVMSCMEVVDAKTGGSHGTPKQQVTAGSPASVVGGESGECPF